MRLVLSVILTLEAIKFEKDDVFNKLAGLSLRWLTVFLRRDEVDLIDLRAEPKVFY